MNININNFEITKIEQCIKPIVVGNIGGRIAKQIEFGFEKCLHLFNENKWISRPEQEDDQLKKDLQTLNDSMKDIERAEEPIAPSELKKINQEIENRLKQMLKICRLIQKSPRNEDSVGKVEKELQNFISDCQERIKKLEEKIVIENEVLEPKKKTPLSKEEKEKREKIFTVELNRLFNERAPTEGKKPLLVSGYVMSDGKGDYIHMSRLIHKLRKKFPDRSIVAVIVSAKTHKGKLTPIKLDNCEVYMAYYGEERDSTAVPTTIPEDIFGNTSSEIVKKIKDAALWINGPININGGPFNRLDQKPEMMRISEYDMLTNRVEGFLYDANMGLAVNAKGVFIKKEKEYSWADLENQRLKNVLFDVQLLDTEEVSKRKISHYSSLKNLFLCYVGMFPVAKSFILDAIAYNHAHGKDKEIDICYPCKGNIENFASSLEGEKDMLEKLKGFGIGAIKVVYFNGHNEKKERVIRLSDEGKELRIIDVGPLSKRDFNRVAYLSSPLMGCTGDSSLGVALSFGKLPYYENRKPELLRSMYRLAEEKFGCKSALCKYLQSIFPQKSEFDIEVCEREQENLRSPELMVQARELSNFIRENYSFDLYFTGWVNNILFRQEHPDYATFENDVRRRFVNGELSLEESRRLLVEHM